MADWLTYANKNAIRNDPLNQKLVNALNFLPELGVTAQVFSGGQENNTTSGTGSTRHNHGGAGDFLFFKDGRQLDWANPEDRPIFEEIVRRGRAAGITGIGAGPGYMQPGSMHLGFGSPAVWGDDGKAANAPEWLRSAYNGKSPERPLSMAASSSVNATPQGVGAALGGFSGGTAQVAGRASPGPSVQPASIEGTGDMRPTNFQRMAARQAMEGDQSQRARLLQAAGLDPTGKTRLQPRPEVSGGILAQLLGQRPPASPDAMPGGILANFLSKLF